MGAARGALWWHPQSNEWRHVRLQDEPVQACGAGSGCVWLASRQWLMQPEAHGAGVRRFRLADATGTAACVDGVAADRGGIWIAVHGFDGPLPGLLRLPHAPPVFQCYQPRVSHAMGRVLAIAGDGTTAWALGADAVLELDERTVARPGMPDLSSPPAPRLTPAAPEDPMAALIARLCPDAWLRVQPRGLVGRNQEGLFCVAHGSSASVSPSLPGRLDLFATDWLGHENAMLVATALGLYVARGGELSLIAPGEEIIALIDGDPPLAITRTQVIRLDAAELASAPRVQVDLTTVARSLARQRASDTAAHQRRLVAEALALVGETADMPLLMTLLSDPAAEVRAATCLAVGRLKPAGARAVLAQMMADPVTSVQAAAGQALRDA